MQELLAVDELEPVLKRLADRCRAVESKPVLGKDSGEDLGTDAVTGGHFAWTQWMKVRAKRMNRTGKRTK